MRVGPYLFLALALLMLADCLLGVYLDRRLVGYVKPTEHVGQAWDTSTNTESGITWFTEELPELRTPVSATWRLGYIDPATHAATYPMTFTSSGEFRLVERPWYRVVWVRRGHWWQLRTLDDRWLLGLAPSFAKVAPHD